MKPAVLQGNGSEPARDPSGRSHLGSGLRVGEDCADCTRFREGDLILYINLVPFSILYQSAVLFLHYLAGDRSAGSGMLFCYGL